MIHYDDDVYHVTITKLPKRDLTGEIIREEVPTRVETKKILGKRHFSEIDERDGKKPHIALGNVLYNNFGHNFSFDE
jgi:hypothetical protein